VKSARRSPTFVTEAHSLLLAPFALAVAASSCGGAVAGSPPAGNMGQDAGDDASGEDAPSSPDAPAASEAAPPVDASTGTEGAPPPVGSLIAVPLDECLPLVYTANVNIGSQTFQLSIDTGSTTLGVASSQCTDCNVTPLYTPGTTAMDQLQTAMSQYGTGSWTAEIYQDSVGFASDPTVPLKFGAITTQMGFFGQQMFCQSGNTYQGIMGLDRATSELPGTNAFFDQFVQARGIANVFATELCDTKGTLWLGGYDTTVATAAPQYTPVTTDTASSYYYTVDLESITLDGSTTPISIAAGSQFPDTVVDTGTTALVVPNGVFTTLTNALAASPGFAHVFGAGTGASLFTNPQPCGGAGVTKAQIDSELPGLTFTFGQNPAKTIQMAASDSWLVPISGVGWCALVTAVPSGQQFPLAAIMGSPFLRSQITIFDRANGQIGFAPHTACQ
jgi:hypothetical protein